MNNEILQANERHLILADAHGLLNSQLIRTLAVRMSRRGIVIGQPVRAEEVDWDSLYEESERLLTDLSAFGQGSPEESSHAARKVLEKHLPSYVAAAAQNFNRLMRFRGLPRASQGEVFYHQLAKGQRSAVAKDAAAILAQQLAANGYDLFKDSAEVYIDQMDFLESLTEEMARHDGQGDMWDSLSPEEKQDYALGNEPYMRPLANSLFSQFTDQIRHQGPPREPHGSAHTQ